MEDVWEQEDVYFLGVGWLWFPFLQKVGTQLGSPCTQMQMKHRPVGRAGGEGDPAGSDEGAWSPTGDNRSIRDGGGSDSQSISLIWVWDEGARMVEGIFT